MAVPGTMRSAIACTILLAVCHYVGAYPMESQERAANPDLGQDDAKSPHFIGQILALVENIPALKAMLAKTGFSLDELKTLFGERNIFGKLIDNVYKLSPVAGQIIDDAAKTNAEIRVLLAIVRGQTPNLMDLFELAATKQENMFNAADKAASKNAYAQLILKKMKEPNPDITSIWNMLTGRKLDSNQVMETSKYTVATTSQRKNRHLLELTQFIFRNWRPLEKMFRTMSSFPINYNKIMWYILGLDYSPFKFALNAYAPRLNGNKYMITGNEGSKGKYVISHPDWNSGEDADIANVLQELRVKYPAMHSAFAATGGNAIARKAVVHLLEESIEIFNRLLGSAPRRKPSA